MTEFLVEGMSCSHCADAVTRAVRALDPVASVQVDLGGKRVRIESGVDDARLSGAIDGAGYASTPVTGRDVRDPGS